MNEVQSTSPAGEVLLRGRRVAYRESGSGSVVVLVHGLAGSMRTWDAVMPKLAARHTVVALDLPGHGRSEQPAGDYSLGAFASILRDLLDVLGHRTATVVGHSLGGGIALQFAYQFPERCQRLVLVASGGLGTDVSPLLRAAALPGSNFVFPVITNSRVVDAGSAAVRWARKAGLRLTAAQMESIGSYAALAVPARRQAFLRTLRSVVDHRGQRVTAVDTLQQLRDLPTLLVWSANDWIVPVEHAYAAHDAIAGSRLTVFEDGGHFPHVAHPARFAQVVASFVDS